MAFEGDLVTYLRAHSGLAALVGTRIYPDELVQDVTYPAVVYMRVSGVRLHVASYVRARYQFTCWGQTTASAHGYDTAKSVGAQLVSALENYHGAFGSTHGFAQVETDFDGPTDPQSGLYSVIVDARIHYQEA